MSTASVPPPGWVEPQRATTPLGAPERPSPTGDFATTIAHEDRRRLDTKRVTARIIDNLLCLPVYLAALYEWGTVLLAWTLMSLVHLLVAHLCEVTTGATPGKHLMRLRVADKSTGALPSPRQAAARGVIGLAESNLIGLIALHVSKGRTRLGDRAAGTVVVDTVRHPIASRGLTGGALVYPIAWVIPVALVCLGAAKHHSSVTYRQQADALCHQADVAIDTGMPVRGLPAVVAAYQQLDAGLGRLHPPAEWRERHDHLAGQVHANAVGLALQVRAASTQPKADWRSLGESAGVQYAKMKDVAKAASYHDCAR